MKKTPCLIAAIALLASGTHAAILAQYVPIGAADNSTLSATTLDPGISASAIGNIATDNSLGLSSGGAGPVRSIFNTNLLWGGGARLTVVSDSDAAGSDDDTSATTNYFNFTLSSAILGATLDLTNMTFDWAVGTTRSGGLTNVYAWYSVYASVDGGSFQKVGERGTTSGANLTRNQTRNMSTRNIDLSSITGAESVEFRIWVGSNINSSDTASAFRNITVNGTVIPEPSAALLGGIGMLALLRRRR